MKIQKIINQISTKTLIIFALFLATLIAVLIFLNKYKPANAGWWNNSWQYRKAIRLDNGPTDMSGYQTYIVTDTATPISDGKMDVDCSDIRIVDQNGKQLPFWIETGRYGCNQSLTNIWIKINKLSANSSSFIYIYYGNSSAPPLSNGNEVFEFFDDFNNIPGSFDTAKWTSGNVGTPTGSNFSIGSSGYLVGNNTSWYLQSNKTFNYYSYAIETRVLETTSATNGFMVAGFHKSSSDSYGLLSHNTTSYLYSNGTWTNQSFNSFNQWIRASIKTESTNTTVSEYIEGGSGYNAGLTHSLDGHKIRIGTRYDTANSGQSYTAYWDWIFVRKYSASGYVNSAGYSENTNPNPNPIGHWSFDEGSGTTIHNQMIVDNDKGLVAWWKLDETSATTAVDETGNISGTPTGTGVSAGKIGNARTFNGSTDLINLGNPASLQITGDQTIEMWLNPTNLNNRQNPFAKAYAGEGTITLEPAGNLSYYYGTDGTNGTHYQGFNSGATISAGVWSHVAIVRDLKRMVLSWYINGNLVASTPALYSAAVAGSLNAYIGAGYVTNFIGSIDSVKIYNRALTDAEINTEYNSLNGAAINFNISSSIMSFTSTANDGVISGSSNNYNIARTTPTTVSNNTNWLNFGQSANPLGSISVSRSYLEFDTAAIPDNATVSDVRLSMKKSGAQQCPSGDFIPRIYKYNWASPLGSGSTATTYNAPGSVFDQNWNISCQGMSNDTWYTTPVSLDTNWVNKTGYTRYQLRSSKDDDAISPPIMWYFEYLQPYTSETGTSAPYITVTYSLPSPWTDGAQANSNQKPLGKSLLFSNSENAAYVDIPGDGALQNTTDDSYSFSIWVKPSSTLPPGNPQYDQMTAIGRQTPSGFNTTLGYDVDQKFDWRIYTTNGIFGITAPDIYAPNQWHHLVGTVNTSTNQFKLYVDGQIKNTGNFTGSPRDYSTYNYRLGSSLTGACNTNYTMCFNGFLDEAKIFNYALNPQQVTNEYNRSASTVLGVGKKASDPGSNGLQAWWKLDDGSVTSAADSSGNNYTGILGSGASAPTWTSGKFGKALSFDGSDYLNVNNIHPFTNPFTVSLWANFNSVNRGADNALISQGATGTDNGLHIGERTSKAYFGFYGDDLSGNQTLAAGNWYHLVFVYTGTQKLIYVNGALDNSGSSGTYQNNIANTEIGRYPWAPTVTMQGKIDNVKIFSRVLSPDEISYEYSQNGPIAHWSFDQINNTTLLDNLSNFNLTTTNGPTLSDGAQAQTNQHPQGKSLTLNGTNQYASKSNSTLNLSKNFSISTWIKTSTLASYKPIFAKYSTTTTAPYIGLYGSGGSLRLECSDVGSNTRSFDWNSAIDGTGLTDNKWHLVTITYDGTNFKSYKDGIFQNTSSSWTYGCGNTSDTLYVGYFWGGNYFNGSIDELKIYSYTLSPDDIKLDYNGGQGVVLGDGINQSDPNLQIGTTSSLVGWWKLDENSGTSIYDSSGRNYNGTLLSSPTWTPGKYGKALNFDNVDDGVSINNQNFTSLSDYSMCAWVYLKGTHKNYTGTILSSGDWNNTHWAFGLSQDNTAINLRKPDGVNSPSFSYSFSYNKWTFVCITRSSTLITAYVNGLNIGTYTGTTGNLISNATNTTIGRETYAGGYFDFNGAIDNVKIYNRGLSQSEISYEYSQGKPIIHLRFNEKYGTVFYNDYSSTTTMNPYNINSTSDHVAGKFGNALHFNGTNASISYPNLSSPYLTSETISFWFKADRVSNGGSNGYSCDIINHSYFSGSGWAIEWRNSGSFALDYFYSGGWSAVSIPGGFTDTTSWHSFIATIVSNGQIKIWLDGVYKNSANIGAWQDANSSNYIFGSGYENNTNDPSWYNQNFHGAIDEFKVYNYAMTDQQVKVEYNNGASVRLTN